jgi:hypothetical protein
MQDHQSAVRPETETASHEEGTGVIDLNRRGFLGRAGVAAAVAAVGMNVPFARNLRDGWVSTA